MTKKELLERFRKLPTGNISDAMDDMGMPRQVVYGLHPSGHGLSRAAGWAYTVQQMRRRPDTEKKSLTRQLEAVDARASEGDFVVIANGGRTDVATLGGIIVRRAKCRGINGILVDGCARDLEEIAEMDFPLYLKDTSPVRSKGDVETAAMQVPVEICGVQIRPGDLIVADATGILAVPAEMAEQVYERAKAIYDREEKLVKAIDAGMSVEEYNRSLEVEK